MVNMSAGLQHDRLSQSVDKSAQANGYRHKGGSSSSTVNNIAIAPNSSVTATKLPRYSHKYQSVGNSAVSGNNGQSNSGYDSHPGQN